MWVRAGRGRVGQGSAGGAGWAGRGLGPGLLLVCLDPAQQAVQGALCEGESRRSRLLGLVRYRPERGGEEHASVTGSVLASLALGFIILHCPSSWTSCPLGQSLRRLE